MSVTALRIGSDNVSCRMCGHYVCCIPKRRNNRAGIALGLYIVRVLFPVGIVLIPSEALCRGR